MNIGNADTAEAVGKYAAAHDDIISIDGIPIRVIRVGRRRRIHGIAVESRGLVKVSCQSGVVTYDV